MISGCLLYLNGNQTKKKTDIFLLEISYISWDNDDVEINLNTSAFCLLEQF